ncbi:MAG: hypothetical protein ACP5RC_09465 [Halothiobacillaceae bacterium]
MANPTLKWGDNGRPRMLIADCPHSFAYLATVVLPAHMAKMRVTLKSPHAAATFSVPGSGPKTIATAIAKRRSPTPGQRAQAMVWPPFQKALGVEVAVLNGVGVPSS